MNTVNKFVSIRYPTFMAWVGWIMQPPLLPRIPKSWVEHACSSRKLTHGCPPCSKHRTWWQIWSSKFPTVWIKAMRDMGNELLATWIKVGCRSGWARVEVLAVIIVFLASLPTHLCAPNLTAMVSSTLRGGGGGGLCGAHNRHPMHRACQHV